MRHPGPEQWSDYVRGVLPVEMTASLKEHLGLGCGNCVRQVRAFEAVLRVAETDLRIEPPAFAVRSVKNLFRVQQLIEKSQEHRLSLELIFDTVLAPSMVGVRSAATNDRHLVYECSDLKLDVQLQAGEKSAPLRVVGQVMDSHSSPVTDVPAFLLKGGRIYSQDLTGSMGEFRLLGESESSPHLCLLIENDRLVDIRLPNLHEPKR